MNVKMIDIDRLTPNSWNSSRLAGEPYSSPLNEVRDYGQTVKPVVVRPDGNGGVTIIDGEHPWRAACNAGLAQVPCEVIDDFEARRQEQPAERESSMSELKPTDPREADLEEAIELAKPEPPPDVLGTAHPVAELFPLLPSAELDALAADIKANGLREPIWRHRDGRIIDGRNRWLACQMAGVECPCRVFMGDDAELLQFVLSMNLRRRHLDESQRAMVAAKVANLGEGRPKETSRIQPVSQASAAALLSVGVSSVKAAKQVRAKGAPEVVKAVEEGRLAVSTAAGLAARPQDKQREILAKVEQAQQVAGRKKLQPERRRPMPTQARKLARETKRAVAASDGERHTGETAEEEPTDAAAAGDLPPRAGRSPSMQAMFKTLEELARVVHAATPEERARFWGDARPTFEALTSLFQAASSLTARSTSW
jgi:ParB-like chromosome segregation protein Spo0J